MSKSAGEFLTLQRLVDKGVHPLAYRLMCLQAHYRSELEFSWDNLLAALTRLKRMVGQCVLLRKQEPRAASNGTGGPGLLLSQEHITPFDQSVSDDLNTPKALTILDDMLADKKLEAGTKHASLAAMDRLLGLNLLTLTREELRVRPADAAIDETEIDRELDLREDARASKNFPAADAIRDNLAEHGVEIMDGDPLRWEWRITA